jgi:hypothetical protein
MNKREKVILFCSVAIIITDTWHLSGNLPLDALSLTAHIMFGGLSLLCAIAALRE